MSTIRPTREGFATSSVESTGVSWKERVVPSQWLDFERLDGRLVVNG